MWNYYVKDGNYQGYNLKFRVGDLLDCFKPISNRRIDIFYGRVIYEENDQINILQEVINRIDTNIYETLRNPAIDEINYDVVKQRFMGELLEYLEDFRLFFKARSFSAEREYRFVIRLPLDFEDANSNLIETGYDLKNGLIVPYCGLKVNNRSNTFIGVTLSPMLESILAENGLRRFLRSYQYNNDIEIKQSEIPIRY
jgi:hypothetical protein